MTACQCTHVHACRWRIAPSAGTCNQCWKHTSCPTLRLSNSIWSSMAEQWSSMVDHIQQTHGSYNSTDVDRGLTEFRWWFQHEFATTIIQFACLGRVQQGFDNIQLVAQVVRIVRGNQLQRTWLGLALLGHIVLISDMAGSSAMRRPIVSSTDPCHVAPWMKPSAVRVDIRGRITA